MTKMLQRLQQMAQNQQRSSANSDNLLHHIWTRTVVTADDLVELLEQPSQFLPDHVQVVVLDSMADLFRAGNNNNHSSNGTTAQLLYYVAQLLQRLHLPVLCLNQVTLNTQNPALGVSWAHCVQTQYAVDQTRTLRIIKSSAHACPQKVDFAIQAGGVVCCCCAAASPS